MLDSKVKPSVIVKYLDDFVIGQDAAKKILSVAVYAHYRKIERAAADSRDWPLGDDAGRRPLCPATYRPRGGAGPADGPALAA